MKISPYSPRSQRGMVLVTSLVILLVLTVLGLAAVQNTSLEERMAGNLRAENVALQAAEAALREGEAWIFLRGATPVPVPYSRRTADSVWPLNEPELVKNLTGSQWWEEWSNSDWEEINYTTALTDPLVYTGSSSDVVPQPRYLIEERGLAKESAVVGQQGDFAGTMFYQVTARGVDAGGRSEVIVRSTYGRRF
jgi:type IV pilus assembly protein PilX